MLRIERHRSWWRTTAIVVIAAQSLLGVPVAARSPVSSDIAPSTPPPPAPVVKVNRTPPRVAAPPLEPRFSSSPTAVEIGHARVFDEPLTPVGGTPSVEENRALSSALLGFHRSLGRDWHATIGDFLATHPDSAWRPSLLANLGTIERQAHRYANALDMWDEAWSLTRQANDSASRRVADYAMAEWVTLAASFGQVEQVRKRLNTLVGRPLTGSAGAKIARARETLSLIEMYPNLNSLCGPQAIRALIEASGTTNASGLATLDAYRGELKGMSLFELQTLARRAGVRLAIAERVDARDVPVPSIVHWRIGHYAAVVERQGDRYRIVDRARHDSYWIDRATLFSESSGYFLISRENGRPAGWRAVASRAASLVVGSGPLCPDGASSDDSPDDFSASDWSPPPDDFSSNDVSSDDSSGDESSSDDFSSDDTTTTVSAGDNDGSSDDEAQEDSGTCEAMCGYRFQAISASLVLLDTPVRYTPPRGLRIAFTLGYHQRDITQAATFSYSNLGPKWSLNWIRFVKEEPTDGLGVTPAHVWVSLPPGGREQFINPDAQGVYSAHWSSRAVLVHVSDNPVRYERRLPHGTVEVYAQSDGAPAGARRIFLTQIISPRGHSVLLTWDAQCRLVAISDALGQVSTISYDLASDPLKVSSITDPFGRQASLTYNAAGELESITDVLGLTSRFSYGSNDFVSTLTTPYGSTSFRSETPALNSSYTLRFIEATDPLGATRHLEFRYQTDAIAATAATGEVPTGFGAWNTNLDHFNTFYWNRRAWAAGQGDTSKAVIIHWVQAPEWDGWQIYSVPVPHSVKRPLEKRVWHAYPGQTSQSASADRIGWSKKPSDVARVLDDGTSEIWSTTYTDRGRVLTRTDPLGRQTSYVYATNGIDLLEVRQTTGGASDLLSSYSNYTSAHEPQTIVDAAAQTMTLTYNVDGNVVTVTNPHQETTTYGYDTNGYLTSVTGALSGAVTTLGHDAYGRVRTVTGPDGYTVTRDYDAFDRPTRATRPDGTYDEIAYDRLDASAYRDRLGRVTRYYHDARRHLIGVRDPQGHTVTQTWCPCGSLDAVVDASEHRTAWQRDLEGRVTTEIRANGSSVQYGYASTNSRLLQRTDAKGQVTTYQYGVDGALLGITYSNATTATPAVTFAYDPAYPRLTSRTDGAGTTSYTYRAIGTLGAGEIATIDGPLSNDTITFAYDVLGRATSRTLGSTTDNVTYDGLGRPTTVVDPIGTFTWTYDGSTARVAQVTYPNGQTSSYTYLGNSNDHRLQEIHHRTSSGATLSRFSYGYDARGNITTWTQQYQATTRAYDLTYDGADELTAATYRTTEATPTVLTRYLYRYDAAGNRTGAQVDDAPLVWTYNTMNQATAQGGSALLQFEGTINEAGSVTIAGKPATVDGTGKFIGSASVTNGTNTVSITAKDTSGNVTTQAYDVDVTDVIGTFAYDANGNLTTHGTRTYEWDAENRLVRVRSSGTEMASFAYDGAGRRVSKTSGGMTHRYVYDGSDIVEDRADAGATVRQLHGPGIDRLLATVDGAGTVSYYLADHLGSIVQATDVAQQVTLTRQYDPWGTLTTGAATSGYAFTGREWDAETGLYYYRARYYDPAVGRFLSVDPVSLGGIDAYNYVGNNPVLFVDPNGTNPVAAIGILIGGAVTLPAWVTTGLIVTTAIGTGILVDEYIIKPLFAEDNSLPRGLPPKGVLPPVENPAGLKEGPPSRPNEEGRGARHLWDEKGGEWRWHPEDSDHNAHWDYNPHAKPYDPWQQVPYGNKPPKKAC